MPIFARPLPLHRLSGGRRHVPRFMVANGVPFLKFKRRQSPILSSVIRGTQTSRQKRTDRIYGLEHLKRLAEAEDAWDSMTSHESHFRERKGEAESKGGSWVTELREAIAEQEARGHASARRSRQMAKKMWAVVVQERELQQAEKAEKRKAGKTSKGQ